MRLKRETRKGKEANPDDGTTTSDERSDAWNGGLAECLAVNHTAEQEEASDVAFNPDLGPQATPTAAVSCEAGCLFRQRQTARQRPAISPLTYSTTRGPRGRSQRRSPVKHRRRWNKERRRCCQLSPESARNTPSAIFPPESARKTDPGMRCCTGIGGYVS